jgi:hypothetical protein
VDPEAPAAADPAARQVSIQAQDVLEALALGHAHEARARQRERLPAANR